ncbi:MAG: DUF5615 family PIN-like protein [candidate division NC10 bacterium]|nr:DUF5615 family PIN-like protein [candidate division NC10 bacterium]
MRWLIDEGLPKALIEWLTERGDDVLDIADSPLRGADDTVLWKRAGQEGRILMTRDLGFMLPKVQPQPVGVVLVRIPDIQGRRHPEEDGGRRRLQVFVRETHPPPARRSKERGGRDRGPKKHNALRFRPQNFGELIPGAVLVDGGDWRGLYRTRSIEDQLRWLQGFA